MSRPLRIEYPDAWYHVMSRARVGQKAFLDRKDYYSFIDLLKDTSNRVRGISRLSKRVEGLAAKNKGRYSPEEIVDIDSSLAAISEKMAELKQIFQSTIANIKKTFGDLREFKRTVGAQQGRQSPPSGHVPPQRRQRGR